MSSTQTKLLVRYSPHPIEHYGRKIQGIACGPSASALLTNPFAWNLAYLSHPYEDGIEPEDPHFTVAVHHTTRMHLVGSVDITGMSPLSSTFASFMSLPAPRAVYLMLRHRVIEGTALHLRYGAKWLEMIERRSRLCTTQDPDNVIDVPHVRDAAAYLLRLAWGRHGQG